MGCVVCLKGSDKCFMISIKLGLVCRCCIFWAVFVHFSADVCFSSRFDTETIVRKLSIGWNKGAEVDADMQVAHRNDAP